MDEMKSESDQRKGSFQRGPVKKARSTRILLALLLMATGACSPVGQMSGSSGAGSHNFTIQHPEGWKKLNTPKYYILTRDGCFKQYILAQQRPLDKPFKHSKALMKKGLPPQEGAQVVIDEINADTSVRDFRVGAIAPATVGLHQGFRITWSYTTEKGYHFLGVYYGFVVGEWFYSLRYNASEKYYCDADLTAFQDVLSSFTLKAADS